MAHKEHSRSSLIMKTKTQQLAQHIKRVQQSEVII